MKLQTQIKLKKKEHNLIDYNSKLLLLGSCFSENIGGRFKYFKFQSSSNPFGILFHPKAIENLVVRALKQKEYSENNVFFNNEQWHCFDAHSKLSNVLKEVLIEDLNKNLERTKKQISKSTHVIITLGTAWVYKLIDSNKTVANCHKLPQKQFNKSLLTIEKIKQSLQSIIEAVQQVNKKASIIFTVSPVRHIKDGFVENTLSKSHLISAIHQVTSSQVSYFPSYEIMLDELRDYRFYKSDMLHPNETAVEYIWQKFQQVWVASDAIKTMEAIDVIQKGLKHKPFNKNSEAHKRFLKQIENQKLEIQSKIKYIKF